MASPATFLHLAEADVAGKPELIYVGDPMCSSSLPAADSTWKAAQDTGSSVRFV